MQKLRILIIGDNDTFSHFKPLLAKSALDVTTELIGEDADRLDALLNGQYDICLLDEQASSSGIELVKSATARAVNIPIIVLSSEKDPNGGIPYLQAGAADYLHKADLTSDSLKRSISYALERTRFFQEIRASEQRYRRLIVDAFEGILITNEQGRIVFANKKICEMLGYPAAALLEMNVQDIVDNRNAVQNFITIEEANLLESHLRHQNGQLLDVEVSVNRINGDQVQFIARDITERKATREERERHIQQLTILHQVDAELSQVLNIEYVLSLGLDASVRLSGANAGFIGLIDQTRVHLAEAIGHYADVVSDEDVSESPLILALMNDMEPRLIPDVNEVPYYVSVHPQTRAQMLFPLVSYERLIGILNLETNKPERFTKETFDFLKLITARIAVAVENAQLYKIAQDQLIELQELYIQVSNLEQLKTDMIRIAAHDLRNPVSIILGYVELLRRTMGDPDREKQLDFIQMIESAARRMEKMTTDILSLERIENLQTQEGQVINLRELVRATCLEFEAQAKQKGQNYHLDIVESGLPVQADSTQLREAIANLISNAIKYTPEAGTITVHMSRQDKEAIFKVIDSGYGVPENQQASLFQPFFRAHSPETARIEGTGLGLYLIKNIIERYHGSIIFESTYGQGSTFGFRLPLS